MDFLSDHVYLKGPLLTLSCSCSCQLSIPDWIKDLQLGLAGRGGRGVLPQDNEIRNNEAGPHSYWTRHSLFSQWIR